MHVFRPVFSRKKTRKSSEHFRPAQIGVCLETGKMQKSPEWRIMRVFWHSKWQNAAVFRSIDLKFCSMCSSACAFLHKFPSKRYFYEIFKIKFESLIPSIYTCESQSVPSSKKCTLDDSRKPWPFFDWNRQDITSLWSRKISLVSMCKIDKKCLCEVWRRQVFTICIQFWAIERYSQGEGFSFALASLTGRGLMAVWW